MPEGPSIVILKEAVQGLHLEGKKIVHAGGNSKIGIDRLEGQKVTAFRSWGKHFLICFDAFFLRIHFLLFGTYRINERKGVPERLRLQFAKDELNFYACSVQLIEKPVDEVYDWSVDVMSEHWSPGRALKKLQAAPEMLACDALLDQDIFAGSGNIFKNEVLFRIRVHPLSRIGKLPEAKVKAIVREVRKYGFQFLEWKKQFVLKQHWKAHRQKICPRCHIPFHKEYLGKTNRVSYFCTGCQVNYH